MKSPRVYLPVGLLCAIFLAVILYPVFMKSPNIPQWRREADRFAYDLGGIIKQYANSNNGRLPSTLKELYPEYTKDPRVTQDVGVFAGKRLLINYNKSAKLGDRDSVIMELRLTRKIHAGEFFRPVRLYGDLQVTPNM